MVIDVVFSWSFLYTENSQRHCAIYKYIILWSYKKMWKVMNISHRKLEIRVKVKEVKLMVDVDFSLYRNFGKQNKTTVWKQLSLIWSLQSLLVPRGVGDLPVIIYFLNFKTHAFTWRRFPALLDKYYNDWFNYCQAQLSWISKHFWIVIVIIFSVEWNIWILWNRYSKFHGSVWTILLGR